MAPYYNPWHGLAAGSEKLAQAKASTGKVQSHVEFDRHIDRVKLLVQQLEAEDQSKVLTSAVSATSAAPVEDIHPSPLEFIAPAEEFPQEPEGTESIPPLRRSARTPARRTDTDPQSSTKIAPASTGKRTRGQGQGFRHRAFSQASVNIFKVSFIYCGK